MAKKYIITEKETDRIIAMGKELSVQENGYWWLILSDVAYPNTFCFAYDANGQIANTIDPSTIGEPIEIPVGVKAEKYCYTPERGFYENPDYVEPGNE